MRSRGAMQQNQFFALIGNDTMAKLGGRILLCMSFAALPAMATADLVDRGLVTYDTQSGLEWLDLSETLGLSFNQVSAQFGAGGRYAGYRYATTLEAQNLLSDFGLPIVAYTAYAPNTWLPNLTRFDALLGLNVRGLGPAYAFGAETGDALDGGYRQFLFGYDSAISTAMNADPADVIGVGDLLVSQSAGVTVGYSTSYADRNLSHFLVRNGAPVAAVPEPETFALMLAGLVAVGVISRRRKRSS